VTTRYLAALAAVSMIFAAAPSRAQNLDPITRSKIDVQLSKANTVGDLLRVASRYAAAGYKQEAKAAVDRAVPKARLATEWQAIAGAYQGLGYGENASVAKRKAREVSR
jgi:hypothetical protein